MDDTRLFYRHLHVWHNNKHEVKRLLLNRIQSYDILDYRYRLLCIHRPHFHSLFTISILFFIQFCGGELDPPFLPLLVYYT
eukprot:SAG25_NODE_2631_length_1480_cov_9.401159_1_plen_80_part_10